MKNSEKKMGQKKKRSVTITQKYSSKYVSAFAQV